MADEAPPAADAEELSAPAYTGGVVLDSRLLEAWAAGELTNGAMRVYSYACLRREAHGAIAKIGDREMAAGAKVARKPTTRQALCLWDYIGELQTWAAGQDPVPFSVVREEKHRTQYVVPRPPRERVTAEPSGARTRTRAGGDGKTIWGAQSDQSGARTRTRAGGDGKTIWGAQSDQSGARTRTSLQEGGYTPPTPPPTSVGGEGQRVDPPPSGSPPSPGGDGQRMCPPASGSPPSPGGEEPEAAGSAAPRPGGESPLPEPVSRPNGGISSVWENLYANAVAAGDSKAIQALTSFGFAPGIREQRDRHRAEVAEHRSRRRIAKGAAASDARARLKAALAADHREESGDVSG